MKFSVFLMQYATPGTQTTLFQDLREQVGLMEKLGYYSALLGERHLYRDGWFELQCVLAGLATLTKRLRLGTHVLLYPLYDPLHVAEFMATLDVITEGRLEFGVGLGYRSQELEAFNIPLNERGGRLEEAIILTRRLWTEDSVTFHGKHYQYKDVFVSPKPIQKPHPPILVAGMADGAVERAARLGDGWATPNNATISELREKCKLYRETLKKHRKKGRIVVFREAYVARSEDEARTILEPSLMSLYRMYASWGLPGKAAEVESRLSFDDLVGSVAVLVGTPDDCIVGIENLGKELQADEFCLRFQFPGMKQKDALNAIKLWGQKILSYFDNRGL